MKKLNDLFEISYGTKLDLNKMQLASDGEPGVSFVGRSSENNGVSARVQKIDSLIPLNSGLITVALGGSKLLSAFVQENKFYTAQNVAILNPKQKMTFAQKVFLCMCIRLNRFKYSAFGREANRTLKSLDVPEISEFPEWVNSPLANTIDVTGSKTTSLLTLDTENWKSFRYDDVFEIHKGYYNKKPPTGELGNGIPFIGATENRNGITAYIREDDLEAYSRDGSVKIDEPLKRKLFSGGAITVSNNGSVGEAFYQPTAFTCSHDVNPLYLLDKNVKMNPLLGLFLCTIIRADKYRWGYGRKWRPIRMPSSIISLPVNPQGTPDWAYMQRYVSSLPYSARIDED